MHGNSVPRHCIPSKISTAMRDGTETRSRLKYKTIRWKCSVLSMSSGVEMNTSQLIYTCYKFDLYCTVCPFTFRNLLSVQILPHMTPFLCTCFVRVKLQYVFYYLFQLDFSMNQYLQQLPLWSGLEPIQCRWHGFYAVISVKSVCQYSTLPTSIPAKF